MELCEWNPEKNESALIEMHGFPKDGCQNEATLSVGIGTNWHLCESCAALPVFSRLRRRVPLSSNTE